MIARAQIAVPEYTGEVVRGLTSTRKTLPCKYFYDDRGSALFEEITRLPEYYPTRTERGLLEERAAEIVAIAGGAALTDIVELGSGAASKTLALLAAARAAGRKPRYVPADMS